MGRRMGISFVRISRWGGLDWASNEMLLKSRSTTQCKLTNSIWSAKAYIHDLSLSNTWLGHPYSGGFCLGLCRIDQADVVFKTSITNI